MKRKLKSFKKVVIGDTAIDYHETEYKVRDKGSIAELCEKYNERIDFGLSDFLSEGIRKNTNAIIVKSSIRGRNSDLEIFVYGESGARVFYQ